LILLRLVAVRLGFVAVVAKNILFLDGRGGIGSRLVDAILSKLALIVELVTRFK
jgi:hypothetical protein